MKKFKVFFSLTLLLFILASCGGNQSIFQGIRRSELTREEAEDIAVEYIQNSQMYILHNGHNVRQTDWGRMENNDYMFVYEYEVNSNTLPETVNRIQVTLEILDGKAQNAVSEAIYDQ